MYLPRAYLIQACFEHLGFIWCKSCNKIWMHEHEVNALNTESASRSTDNAQGPFPYNLQFTPTAWGSSPSTSECCLFFSSKSLHTDQIRSHYFGMLMIGCRSIQPPPFMLGLADVFVVNTEHVGNFITMYDVILLVKCWPLTADYCWGFIGVIK